MFTSLKALSSKSSLIFALMATALLVPAISSAETTSVKKASNKTESFKTTSVMSEETSNLVRYLENVHYEGRPLAQLDMNKLLETYMSSLDGYRLYFLQSDRVTFEERYGNLLDLYMKQGKLLPAFEVFARYQKRATERYDWIMKRLDQDFDFSTDKKFAPDRSESEWPETIADADAIWEKRLKYELLNEMIALLEQPDKEEEEVASDTSTDSDEEKKSEDIAQSADADTKKSAEDNLKKVVEEIAKEKKAEKTEKEEEKELSDEEILARLTVEKALTKLDEAKELIRKRHQRSKRYLDLIEPVEVQEIFLTSLTHMFDPHSTFLSAETLEDFAIAIKNSLVGIGALLQDDDGYCTIKELIPGGPADTSNKFNPEDRIVGVAQGDDEFVDVIGQKLRKIVKLIRGEKGTKVRLLIQPAGSSPSTRKIVTLVRDKIKLTAQLAQGEIYQIPQGDQTHSIGVINLPAFYGGGPGTKASNTTNDVRELIEKLKEAGVKGLVLDLRNNGGGLLSEAVSLAGLFIPTGPVVQVKDTLGKIRPHADHDKNVAWSGPLIVLVSRYSASASEIVTGALKNHHRALVVGDSATHGKGTVQAVYEMDHRRFGGLIRPSKPTYGAAKVTIQKWYLPNGESTQIRGVASHIPLPSTRSFLKIGEGDLPHALEWDSIDPLSTYNENAFKDKGELGKNFINDELISDLLSSSSERQKELNEFSYHNERIDWLKKRNDQKLFTLNLEERIEERKKERNYTNDLSDRIEALAEKNQFEAEEILLDIAIEKENESRQAKSDKKDEEDEDKPSLDIHLRESLRIMSDWLTKKEDAPEQLAHKAQP